MTVTRAAVGLVVIAVSLAASPRRSQGPDQERPTFRASADAVTVDVSVRDASRVITGLSADQFVVLDNGVPQQVSDVSYGALPIDVTVALDVSYSVTGSLLDQLRRAIRELMRDLRRADRLKLIMFNMRIRRVVDFTADVSAVEAAIGMAAAGGGSAVWDAAAVALVSAAAPDRRQLVMLFTDAADSSSATRPEALFEIAQRTNASLASVVPRAGRASPTRLQVLGLQPLDPMPVRPTALAGTELLQRLAVETGGTQLRVSAVDNLAASFRRILDEFRSSYVLHYVPQGVDRRGFHTLQVGVKGQDGLSIRARRGYYWQ